MPSECQHLSTNLGVHRTHFALRSDITASASCPHCNCSCKQEVSCPTLTAAATGSHDNVPLETFRNSESRPVPHSKPAESSFRSASERVRICHADAVEFAEASLFHHQHCCCGLLGSVPGHLPSAGHPVQHGTPRVFGTCLRLPLFSLISWQWWINLPLKRFPHN